MLGLVARSRNVVCGVVNVEVLNFLQKLQFSDTSLGFSDFRMKFLVFLMELLGFLDFFLR